MRDQKIKARGSNAQPLDTVDEPTFFGQNHRGFAIFTRPQPPFSPRRPVFVFLNSGLLHRVGPFRLYVRMARELGAAGFTSLRVDLTGRGDTAMRRASSYQEAIAADYADIKTTLTSRLGTVDLVLVGLCSGADDAVRLSIGDPSVKGLILLDPVCFKDRGFPIRAVLSTVAECVRHPAFHAQLFLRRLKKILKGKRRINPLDVRETPSQNELRAAVTAIGARDGRLLMIFTRYATRYYNRSGQMKQAVAIDGYDTFCSEIYWPDVSHTYVLDVHRRRLLHTVHEWTRGISEQLSRSAD